MSAKSESSGDSQATTESATSFQPWSSLALLAALALLSFARETPPAAKQADAPASEFSGERARAVLSRLILADAGAHGDAGSSGVPHAVGTAAHALVEARLEDEMRRAGLVPEVQEVLVAGAHSTVALVHNVMARVAGRDHAHALMLAAHYDSVAAGPGAGDDGAGVAAELEIARIVSAGPPLGRDLIFLFTDGEELGLFGAEGFCAQHPWAKDVAVAVNLEGRGTCGPSEMFETSDDNAAWIEIFARAVAHPSATSLAYEVYKRMPNDTDMTVFKRAGMAGLNFAFIGGVRRYHTPLDDLAHLATASLQHHGDNALSLVRALSEAEMPLARADSRVERSVYQDVLGFTLWRWPERFAPSIAILECLIVCGAAFALCRARRVRASALVIGAIAWIAIVLACGAIGFALQRAAVAIAGAPEPWTAHDRAMAIAIVTGTLSVVAIAAASGRLRRIGSRELWLGGWIAFASLGVAIALFVPGASPLFALPLAPMACVACVACALALRTELRESTIGRVLAHVTLAALAVFWIPLAIALERAVGFHAASAIASVLGVSFAFAAATWLEAPRRALIFLAIVLFGASACSLATIVFGTPGSADEPMHLDLALVVDADRREEHWLAATSGWPLSNALRDVGRFDHTRANPFPGWSYDAIVHESPARPTDAAIDAIVPECRFVAAANASRAALGEHSDGAASATHVTLRSRRAARVLLVTATNGTMIRSLALRGQRVSIGRSSVRIVGAGEDEIDLALDVAPGTGAELEIADSTALTRDEAGALFDARPPMCVPRGEGDVSVVTRRFELGR
jgi:hypothetical protein